MSSTLPGLLRQAQSQRKTVDAHRASIKDKLEIKSVNELISYAARWAVQEGADALKVPR